MLAGSDETDRVRPVEPFVEPDTGAKRRISG